MKIAAIQLNADFADVKTNLLQSENYISQAAAIGAEFVLLPEFFTSSIGFSEKMLNVPTQNNHINPSAHALPHFPLFTKNSYYVHNLVIK